MAVREACSACSLPLRVAVLLLVVVVAVSAETPLSARQPCTGTAFAGPAGPSGPCSFEPTCPAEAGRVLLPDPCRCQAYFECVDGGRASRRLCKPWQNFDPVVLRCVWFDEVDCTWPQRTTTTTTLHPTTSTSTTTSSPTSTTTSSPTSTTTSSPTSTTILSPTSTTTLSPTSTTTSSPTSTTTSSPTTAATPPLPTSVPGCAFVPEPCPPAGSSRQAIPCDGYCDKYIECSEGGAMAVRECWWLWAFDHESLACKLYPWVDCAWFH